jgi:hypothetical protein
VVQQVRAVLRVPLHPFPLGGPARPEDRRVRAVQQVRAVRRIPLHPFRLRDPAPPEDRQVQRDQEDQLLHELQLGRLHPVRPLVRPLLVVQLGPPGPLRPVCLAARQVLLLRADLVGLAPLAVRLDQVDQVDLAAPEDLAVARSKKRQIRRTVLLRRWGERA